MRRDGPTCRLLELEKLAAYLAVSAPENERAAEQPVAADGAARRR